MVMVRIGGVRMGVVVVVVLAQPGGRVLGALVVRLVEVVVVVLLGVVHVGVLGGLAGRDVTRRGQVGPLADRHQEERQPQRPPTHRKKVSTLGPGLTAW